VAHPTRPRAKPLAELVGKALDPLVRKRGLARAEMISWWPDIVGAAYAARTAPERISWPRDGKAATLIVRCDPSVVLQFQHETGRVRERLNSYFGYPAVGAVKIVQQRVGAAAAPEPPAKPARPISPKLGEKLDRVDGPLGDSLRRLAKAVIAGS
jgi:hypothetical protein